MADTGAREPQPEPPDYAALLDLEHAARTWVACTREQQRREKHGCPHSALLGGTEDKSCFARTIDAVLALNDARRREAEGA